MTVQVPPIPCAVICPILLTKMEDPVVTEDGFVFERSAIEAWFQLVGCVNPVTGDKLCSFTLTSQSSAREHIGEMLNNMTMADGKCYDNTESQEANMTLCPQEHDEHDMYLLALREILLTSSTHPDMLLDHAQTEANCLSIFEDKKAAHLMPTQAVNAPTIHFPTTLFATPLVEKVGSPQEEAQYPSNISTPQNRTKPIPGKLLASGAGNGLIKLWNLTEMECVATLHQHTGRVNCLLDLGGTIASASSDNLIKLWDVEACRNIITVRGHVGGVCCLTRISPDVFASGSSDACIKLWDSRSGICISCLAGHGSQVQDLLRLADGRLVSSSFDKTIKVWDVEAGRCCGVLHGHSSWVWSIVELGNHMMASSSTDKSIRLWNTKTLSCEGLLGRHLRRAVSLADMGDGLLASSSSDKKIKLWDIDQRENTVTLQGHKNAVHCMVPVEHLKLASGSCDNTIRLWDLASRRCVSVLNGHSDGVFSLSLVHCGNTPISL